MKKIKVHPGKKYLMWEDGSPFFYLGDTAWELFHRLNLEETEKYLSVRAGQGFRVIQACALAELDGLRIPNRYGNLPFRRFPGSGDERKADFPGGIWEPSYWEHVDKVIDMAARYEMFIGLLPCWGDKWNCKKGKGPLIFTDKKTAYRYGRWIGERYRERWNIIWILGGDRPVETKGQEEVIEGMAQGIREADAGHLMTFHPGGASCSSDYFLNRNFIDFHCCQSGHGLEGYESWKYIEKMQEAEEKPCLDMESRYEDHPACFREDYDVFWNQRDVRANQYWNLLQGACGCVYGHNSVWCFRQEKNAYYRHTWEEALMAPGAGQMRYAERFRLSRPYYELLPAPGLAEEKGDVNAHVGAARGERYAMLYLPAGQPLRVHPESFWDAPVICTWFDPGKGEFSGRHIYPSGPVLLEPPVPGQDWAAVLDIV